MFGYSRSFDIRALISPAAILSTIGLLTACGGGYDPQPIPSAPTPPPLVLPVGNDGRGAGTPRDPLTIFPNTGRFEPRAHFGLEIVGMSGNLPTGFVPFEQRIETNPSVAFQRTTTGFDLQLSPNFSIRYDTRTGSGHVDATNSYTNCDDECVGSGLGNKPYTVTFLENASVSLSYSTYGKWRAQPLVSISEFGVFALGTPTEVAQVPTTGSATFYGNGSGHAFTNPYGAYSFIADMTLNANFAARTINGAISNIRATFLQGPTPPANTTFGVANITLSGGTISGNSFSGLTEGGPTAAGTSLLTTGATGQFGGIFYGPNATEAAGSFTLKNSSTNLIGSFGAKR